MNKTVPCTACDKQVSPTAKACTHCGHDLEGERKAKQNTLTSIGLIALMLIGTILFKTGILEEVATLLPSFKDHFSK